MQSTPEKGQSFPIVLASKLRGTLYGVLGIFLVRIYTLPLLHSRLGPSLDFFILLFGRALMLVDEILLQEMMSGRV
jgi:hypothetical protein